MARVVVHCGLSTVECPHGRVVVGQVAKWWSAQLIVTADGSADVLLGYHIPGHGWTPQQHLHGYSGHGLSEAEAVATLVEALTCRLLALSEDDV